MKWLILLLVLLVPGGVLIYGVGCWLLGQKPWDLWREQIPYEAWEMEQRAKETESD